MAETAGTKNRLDQQSSPYLKQHADNPVDWYPWGEEAIEKARREDKPIFLSIGYAACHWCHVMEHESFENAGIAKVLNEHFVSIKVDREERPDIDAIYMRAVQMMTGSGGWPLSVFLLPHNLKPFFGGTYFPPDSNYGRPGFKELILQISGIYKTRKADLEHDAEHLTKKLIEVSLVKRDQDALKKEILEQAAANILSHYDSDLGGFRGAPKFPSPTSLQFLIRQGASKSSRSLEARSAALLTLDQMALGGLYDQLGGGFHRYSTDERWFAPHFEKMLYDNAQLAKLYVQAWQLTGKLFYKQIAVETLDYMLREMKSPRGGFYSSQDADSEGAEGRFYTWTWEELSAALGDGEDLNLAAQQWGLTKEGNWEDGRNILHSTFRHSRESGNPEPSVNFIKKKLFEWRLKYKIPPATDEKVLADWNALAVAVFSYAGAVFGEERYLKAAEDAVAYAQKTFFKKAPEKAPGSNLGLVPGTFSVLHARAGNRDISGFLEDYASWILALTDLYEATLDIEHLNQARVIAKRMVAEFWQADSNAFRSFPKEGADPYLLTNIQESYDGVMPSGTSAAAEALLKIGRYFEDEEMTRIAERVLRAHVAEMEGSPAGVTHFLNVLSEHSEEPWQIEIAGTREDAKWQALWRVTREQWWPARMTALIEGGKGTFPWTIDLPAKPTREPQVYLCKGRNCLLPAKDPKKLAEFLDKEAPGWER
ncbi:MAG: thioredoxin domain-containing protein [Elusimicrobia bacterium]|nr:thioredoxin domain-containing protein [Elusimicrobiota bacterium]